MEAVFKNPSEVRQLFVNTMEQAQESREITDEELAQIVEETEKTPTQTKKGKGKMSKGLEFNLKGEGGSGEGVVPWVKGEVGKGKVKEDVYAGEAKEEQEEEKEKEEERSEAQGETEEEWVPAEEGAGGDVEAHAGDLSYATPSTSSKVHVRMETDLGELRAYCEDQFSTFLSMIQPLIARVESLERQSSNRVPLEMKMRSPPRMSHGRTGSALEKSKEDESKGKGKARRAEIGREKVEEFVKSNGTYPSVKVMRVAKLNQLQKAMGLYPKQLDLKPGEWTVEGVYTQLVVAHDSE